MSNLIDLYQKSQSDRLVKARQIPELEVDYFDREHKVADGFTTEKKTLDPTDFKQTQKYEDLRQDLTPPESFNASLPLHRYGPERRYYDPGQAIE
jgi:hypothetical protein